MSYNVIQCSIIQYILFLLWAYIHVLLSSLVLYLATPFPKTFMQSIKVIFTRMFRIFAIVYHHHYEALHELGAVSHLNTSFKHFIFFIWEYDLVSDAEQEALQDIIKEIRARYAAAFPNRVRTVSGSSTGGAISEGEASSGK